MRFSKDKEYTFMSHSQPFGAAYESRDSFHDVQCTKPVTFKQVLRWEINNYRGFSAYDSPKCENINGKYVKANYVLTLEYQAECQGKKVWIRWRDQEWAFETKKEMDDFLNKSLECMAKGEKGEHGYYNSTEFKIVRKQEA